MPLNGRNYENLLNLRPGVVIQPGGSARTQSINNIRPDETAWMLEGVINANFADFRPIANMPSPLTDWAVILPIDAIQEFNLEENAKAECGWKPGAAVKVGIRSRTNSLHGSAYAFYRDVSWDARNLFNQGPTNGVCVPNPGTPSVCDQLPTQLRQFGGVVGGPVRKDKLFFFAGYEGLRSTVGNVFGTSVPATGPLGSRSLICSITRSSPIRTVHPMAMAALLVEPMTWGPSARLAAGAPHPTWRPAIRRWVREAAATFNSG